MGGLFSPPCTDPSGLQWLTLEVASLEASGLVGLPAPLEELHSAEPEPWERQTEAGKRQEHPRLQGPAHVPC